MKSDPRIVFDEVSHRYWCGNQELTSVTTLINLFKPPFDRERWSKHVANRDGKTVEEVLREWDRSRDLSCASGTLVHSFVEVLLSSPAGSSLELEIDSPIQASAISFLGDNPTSVAGPSSCEVMVCDPDLGLAGTVDFLGPFGGKLTILDWKTNKKIDKRGYGKMLPPIHHLPDCNFSVYSLQLNLYRRILASYDKVVDRMALVHLREDGYKVYDVPVLDKEMDSILATM